MRFSTLYSLVACIALGIVLSCQRGEERLTNTIHGYLAEDRTAEARKVLEGELKKDPDNLNALFLMGWVRMVQGDESAALTLFGRCLHDDPRFYGGHKGMGALYLKTGKPELAEKFFLKALEYKKNSPELYSNLAQSQTQQGNWNAAKVSLEKGRHLRGHRADFDLLLAQNALSRNQPREALEVLEDIDEQSLSNRYYRATVHCVRGEALAQTVEQTAVPSKQLTAEQRKQLGEAKSALEKCRETDPRRFRGGDDLERVATLLGGKSVRPLD